MFYTADAPGSFNYDEVLAEYNRLIATGVAKVFQISIVSSQVRTTYGGVVVENAPASTSGFVSASQADTTEISLNGYSFSRYGKGYLMKPVRGSAYLGNKYFLGGWWNESAGGWFFRRDCVRTLYELGARFEGPFAATPHVNSLPERQHQQHQHQQQEWTSLVASIATTERGFFSSLSLQRTHSTDRSTCSMAGGWRRVMVQDGSSAHDLRIHL